MKLTWKLYHTLTPVIVTALLFSSLIRIPYISKIFMFGLGGIVAFLIVLLSTFLTK